MPSFVAKDGFFSQFYRMNVLVDEVLEPHIIVDPSYAWSSSTGGSIARWTLPIIWVNDLHAQSTWFLTSEVETPTSVLYTFQCGVLSFGVVNMGPTMDILHQSIFEFTPLQVRSFHWEVIEDPFGAFRRLRIGMTPVDPCEAVANGFPIL